MRARNLPILAGAVLGSIALVGAGASSPWAPTVLPPPTFRPAPGWWTLATGPTNAGGLAPQGWAVTVRSADSLVPFDLFNGLRGLRHDAVLIWATTSGKGGPTGVFTRAAWPLRLSTFRVDPTWEGRPAPNVQQRLRWASVKGWRLDVRVYFATQRPSTGLLAEAQAELDRMLLPGAR